MQGKASMMIVSVVLLLSVFGGMAEEPDAQPKLVTLDLDNVRIKDVCAAVKTQADATIVPLDPDIPVSIHVKDASVEEVCQKLAKRIGCKVECVDGIYRLQLDLDPKPAPAPQPAPVVSDRINLNLVGTNIVAACAAIQKQSGVKVTFGGKWPAKRSFDLVIKNARIGDACMTLARVSNCLLSGGPGEGYMLTGKPVQKKGTKGTGRPRLDDGHRRVGPILY